MSELLTTQLQHYIGRHHPNAMVSDLTLLSGGWECDIYAFRLTFNNGQVRDLVLRLFLGNNSAEKTQRESIGLTQLHRAGYPVPEVFLSETDTAILGKAFIIMEKIDGQSLWGVLASVESQQEDHLLNQFGQLVAKLHRLDWQPFTEHASRYQAEPQSIIDDWLNASRRLYQEFEVEGFLRVIDWLDAYAKEITFQAAIVHLDFHANNVLLGKNNRMTVIDWSQLTVADYRCDLSWTLMIMGDNGKTGWHEKILEAYTRTVGQPVQHLDYFNVISCLKLLASTCITLKVGTEKLGMRPQNEDTYHKQKQYLAHLSQRMYDVTRLQVPEVETILKQID